MTLSLDQYFKEIEALLRTDSVFEKLHQTKTIIENIRRQGATVFFVGNGAASAIASHAATDFLKQANTKTRVISDAPLLSAYANDYGYEEVLYGPFKQLASKQDLLVCISVSGESPNLIKVSQFAKENGNRIITFTGKNPNNSVRKLGDINLWVDSAAYNIVEGIHMLWLTAIVDLMIGSSEYDVNYSQNT